MSRTAAAGVAELARNRLLAAADDLHLFRDDPARREAHRERILNLARRMVAAEITAGVPQSARRRIVTCRACHELRPHEAGGKCARCYRRDLAARNAARELGRDAA